MINETLEADREYQKAIAEAKRQAIKSSDCIDRQAALDIFDDYNAAVENGQIEAYSRDRKRLCDLPPAQLSTRAVRGYPIDADALMEKVAEEYGERARDRLYQIIRYMPPAQPDCAKCKSELANKIRGQQDNPGMLTEKDKGRNWGLEWAAQIVEGDKG